MVKVTIELLPGGLELGKKHLGTIEIANNGTGTEFHGSYDVRFSKAHSPKSTWFKDVIRGFPRKTRGPYDLLALALLRSVGDRNSLDETDLEVENLLTEMSLECEEQAP